MEVRKPIVIILSRNHSLGLGVIRALGKEGYTVDLISSAHRTDASDLAASSKYIRKHTEVVSRKRSNYKEHKILEALNEYIDAAYEEELILLPTDEYTMAIVDMNRDYLSEYFTIPMKGNGTEGSLVEYMNHEFQINLANKVGFEKKKEWIIELKDIEIPEELVYPCVCKPCDLPTSSVRDMVTLEDETALKIHLNTLRRKNDEVSVALYNVVDFDCKLEYNGICADGNVYIPAVVKYVDYAQYNDTVESKGVIYDVNKYEDIYEKVVAMMSTLNYEGLFSVEVSIADRKVFFDQMYLRSGQANHALCKCGANLPAIFINKLTEDKDIKEFNIETGKSFVFDNVVRNDFKKEFIDEATYKDILENCDITVIADSDDIEPEKVMLKGRSSRKKKKSLKRRVKDFIKKNIFPILRPIKHKMARYPQMDPVNARNPESPMPRVIVSGRNYGSNLCISRAIGQAGYEVEVLRIFHRKPKRRQLLKKIMPDAYSKYVKAFHICVYGGKSKRVVNKLIRIADPDRKMLIVPADDLVACILDDYYDELSQYYILPNVNEKSGMINHLMSKGVQKELALKAGLPVVNSCIIQTVNGEFDIPDTVTYPCFTKPNISKNGSKTKMKKCDSAEELREHLTAISEKKDVEMLVEDYVEIGREYSILGVSTKKGAIGPGFFGAEEGGQAEHRGVAVTGQVLPVSQWQKLIDDTVKFVGSLGFDGLYDVDFIETVDGKVYFVEVNMRFGGSGYAITASGVNLPGMFADYMLAGKPIDMDIKLEKPGKRFVSEKVLIEEYIKNRMTMDKVNEIMDYVDIHFIKDEEDAQPFKHFRKFYKIAALYRMIYKIKDMADSEFGK